MKEVILTCPFTGLDFTALETADGKLIVKHALTGEDIHVNWNCSIARYNIPKNAFKHVETCTPAQAAEILEVSRQRIDQIIKGNIIPVHMVNGSPVFLLQDVYQYRDTRKAGRRW